MKVNFKVEVYGNDELLETAVDKDFESIKEYQKFIWGNHKKDYYYEFKSKNMNKEIVVKNILTNEEKKVLSTSIIDKNSTRFIYNWAIRITEYKKSVDLGKRKTREEIIKIDNFISKELATQIFDKFVECEKQKPIKKDCEVFITLNGYKSENDALSYKTVILPQLKEN